MASGTGNALLMIGEGGLLKYARHVRLHRCLGEPETSSPISVFVIPASTSSGRLAFTPGELIESSASNLPTFTCVGVSETVDENPWRRSTRALRYLRPPSGVEDGMRVGIFEQETESAGTQRIEDVPVRSM